MEPSNLFVTTDDETTPVAFDPAKVTGTRLTPLYDGAPAPSWIWLRFMGETEFDRTEPEEIEIDVVVPALDENTGELTSKTAKEKRVIEKIVVPVGTKTYRRLTWGPKLIALWPAAMLEVIGGIEIDTADIDMTAADPEFRDAWQVDGDTITLDPKLMKPIARRQVNAWRDEQDRLPIQVDGLGEFSADERSVRNIMGAAQLAGLAMAAEQPYSVAWSLHDNSEIAMDAGQIIALGTALGARTSALYTTARAQKATIEAATSAAEIKDVLAGLE